MKTLLTSVAALAFYATAASAAPIAAGSEISISGGDTFDATSITFASPAALDGTIGSFVELGTAPPVPICATCVTMTSTVFTSSFSGQLFSATNAGDTATLDVSPPASFAFTPGTLPSLTVTGAGTLSLTGFDPTPGTYEVTTQGAGEQVSFSASAIGTAVPEPGTLSLLGVALLALGCLRFQSRRLQCL